MKDIVDNLDTRQNTPQNFKYLFVVFVFVRPQDKGSELPNAVSYQLAGSLTRVLARLQAPWAAAPRKQRPWPKCEVGAVGQPVDEID